MYTYNDLIDTLQENPYLEERVRIVVDGETIYLKESNFLFESDHIIEFKQTFEEKMIEAGGVPSKTMYEWKFKDVIALIAPNGLYIEKRIDL